MINWLNLYEFTLDRGEYESAVYVAARTREEAYSILEDTGVPIKYASVDHGPVIAIADFTNNLAPFVDHNLHKHAENNNRGRARLHWQKHARESDSEQSHCKLLADD